MGFLKVIILLACATTLVRATDSGLREEFELLKAEISELKRKSSALETEVAQVKQELEPSATVDAFDCYLEDYWQTTGIIQFDNCSGRTRNMKCSDYPFFDT